MSTFRERYDKRQEDKLRQKEVAKETRQRILSITDEQIDQMRDEINMSALQSRARQTERGLFAPGEQTESGAAWQAPTMTDEEVGQRHADLQAEVNRTQAALDLFNTAAGEVDPEKKAAAQKAYDDAVAAQKAFTNTLDRDYIGRGEYEYINNIGGAQEAEDERFGRLIFSSEGDHNDMSRYKYMTPEEKAEYNRLYNIAPQYGADYLDMLEDDLSLRQGYTMGQGDVVNQYIGEQAADYEKAVNDAYIANEDAKQNPLLSDEQRAAAQKAYDEAVATRDAYYAQLEKDQTEQSTLDFVVSQTAQMGDYKPERDIFQTLDDTGDAILQSAKGAMGGVFDWIGQTVTDPSAAEYANMFTRESYRDEGANFLGTGKSWQELMLSGGDVIGAMLPGWAASVLNPFLGYAVQGATSGASAYRQARLEGYSNEQANKYGILSGASEAVLSRVLGGIGGKAGLSEDVLLPKIAMWDNALKRVAATVGVNIASEEIEEALQNYAIDPVMRWWLGMDYTAPNAQEVLESALLTAVSSAIMSGGQTVQMGMNPGAFADASSLLQGTGERIATAPAEPRNDTSAGQQSAADMVLEEAGHQTPSNPAAGQTQQVIAPTATQADAGSLTQPSGELPRMSAEDYADNNSPVWRMLEYDDKTSQQQIQQQTDNRMFAEGKAVNIASDPEDALPDLRTMSKKERVPILRQKMTELKSKLRSFLKDLSKGSFEFEVNGNVIEARLYSTGINEVLSQLTQEKTAMLKETAAIFQNAEYLYSLPDYDGNPNIYRWNYFYTPVVIDGNRTGVRIAVRDLVEARGRVSESQIYNWGIKKEAPLGGEGRGSNAGALDASSGAITASIAQPDGSVNGELPSGMGAASAGFSSEFSQWQEQTPDSGFHPVNEAAAQRMMETRGRAVSEVPKKNIAGRLTSKTANTLINAGMTTNEFAAKLETQLANGDFSRMVYTDAEAQTNAEAWIRDRGYEQAKTDWLAEVKAGKMSKDITAQGIALYNNAVNAGDALDALNFATAMIEYSKELGRALQAVNLINKLGPTAELYQLSMSVEMWSEKLKTKLGDRAADLVIKPELAKTFLEAKTDAEKDAARTVLLQDIADQMPGSWPEKFQAWRYLAMLGNPRTHIRNVLGNAGFVPARVMKNIMATAIESGADFVSGGKLTESGNRTKAFLNRNNPQDKALVQAAFADAAQMQNVIQGGGKYDQDVEEIESMRTIWTWNKPAEWARKTNSKLMEGEDWFFSKRVYARSLARYLKANGITADQFLSAAQSAEAGSDTVTVSVPLKEGDRVTAKDRGNVGTIVKDNGDGTYQVHFKNNKGQTATRTLDGKLLVHRDASKRKTVLNGNPASQSEMVQKAREYALLEAQKATYRDANAFADLVSGLRVNTAKKRDDDAHRALDAVANYVIEGVLPFKKTPANILNRAVAYSPLGVIRDIANVTYRVRTGRTTASAAIDNFCQTLTGTALTAAGYFFASQMLVTGGMGDDEEDKFRMMRGEQGYALVVGDKSYTIDWLAPAALPFFVGVELYNVLSSEEEPSTEAVLEAIKTLGSPLLELSMLQSLNDAIEAVAYSETPGVALLVTAATSHLMQYLPTIGGQIERTFLEDERQTYYANRDTWLPGDVQYLLYQGMNKLPFPGAEYNSIDYIDAWGRRESTGSLGERAAENFFSPGYLSEDRSTEIDDELQRLYDEGYDGVLPSRAATDQRVTWEKSDGTPDGRYLTADEYEEYATVRGQTSLEILSDFIGGDRWDDMNDEQRADYVEMVYDYATETAKHDVERRDELPKWMDAKPRRMSEADWIYMAATYGTDTILSYYSDLASMGFDMDEAGDVMDAIAEANARAGALGVKVKPISKLASIAAIEGLTDEERLEAMAIVSGTDAMRRKISAALNAGFTLDEWMEIMDSVYNYPAPTESKPNRTAGTDPSKYIISQWAAEVFPDDLEKQELIVSIYTDN